MAKMKRVTLKRVNETIKDLGFELQRGYGYYYFTRTTDESPIISEDGVYGCVLLRSVSLEWWRKELLSRIEAG